MFNAEASLKRKLRRVPLLTKNIFREERIPSSAASFFVIGLYVHLPRTWAYFNNF